MAAPRFSRRPDDRPEQILAAAFDVFADQGFARARLDDIAARAGVAKGTIYLYFPAKDELFRAVVRSRTADVLAQAEARVASHDGAWRPLFEELVGSMWRTLASERLCLLGRLVQSELGHFPDLARFYFDEVIAPSRGLLRRVLARGAEAGEFRPAAVASAPRAIPAMLLSLALTQRFLEQHDPEAPDDTTLVQAALDLALHGVLAEAA